MFNIIETLRSYSHLRKLLRYPTISAVKWHFTLT